MSKQSGILANALRVEASRYLSSDTGALNESATGDIIKLLSFVAVTVGGLIWFRLSDKKDEKKQEERDQQKRVKDEEARRDDEKKYNEFVVKYKIGTFTPKEISSKEELARFIETDVRKLVQEFNKSDVGKSWIKENITSYCDKLKEEYKDDLTNKWYLDGVKDAKSFKTFACDVFEEYEYNGVYELSLTIIDGHEQDLNIHLSSFLDGLKFICDHRYKECEKFGYKVVISVGDGDEGIISFRISSVDKK